MLVVVLLYNLFISWPFFSNNFSDQSPVVEKDEFYNFLGELPGANGKKSFKTIFQIDFFAFQNEISPKIEYILLGSCHIYLPVLIKVIESNYSHSGISPPKFI